MTYHYTQYFQDTGLKAQVVAPSKYSAVMMQKFFEDGQKVKTALVISDENNIVDDRDEHKKEVVEYLNKIQGDHSDLFSYEKAVIDDFKNSDSGIEILIVVDKLLTGFDAPRNTVLYLAKNLKDHNLLQAIARVNRVYNNDDKNQKVLVLLSIIQKTPNISKKLCNYLVIMMRTMFKILSLMPKIKLMICRKVIKI